jgi:hypothetical protein
MADRALVAYERTDGTYNLHYSHTGGRNLRLKHALSRTTPFGSDAGPQWAREAFGDLQDGAPVEYVADWYRLRTGDADPTLVRPVSIATGVTFEDAITEQLDYLDHAAFYLVDAKFHVTAYRPLWFGFEYVTDAVAKSPSVGHGVLLRLRWVDEMPIDDEYLRGQFVGMKRIVGAMIDREVFDAATAREYLQSQLVDSVGDATLLHVRLQEPDGAREPAPEPVESP